LTLLQDLDVGRRSVSHARSLPRATLTLARHSVMFREIDIAEPQKTGEAARLGSDMLSRFSTVVLDIEKMRLSAAD
jgi:hypothetical protein